MRWKPALALATVAATATAAALVPLTISAGEPEAPAIRHTATPSAVPQGSGSKVLLDVDMGQLNDDAVAMLMLAQSDRSTDIVGVTTVSGNTWVEEGIAYSLKQLELARERSIPVVPGAGVPLLGSRQPTLDAEQELYGKSAYVGSWDRERPDSYRDLPEEPYRGYPTTRPSRQAAADFIAEQVKKHPHEVTLFVLGPATNVALAVRTHPEIVALVKEVIYFGGAIDIPGNTTPAAEFNWWYDPEAAKIALRTPFPKQTVVPNDLAETVFYTKKQYDRIVSGRQTPITKMFEDLHGPNFEDDPAYRSYVWDALTAAIFLDRSIATDVRTRYLDVDDTYGPDYGRALGYPAGDAQNPEGFAKATQQVDIVLDIDRQKFWDLYIDRMKAPVQP